MMRAKRFITRAVAILMLVGAPAGAQGPTASAPAPAEADTWLAPLSDPRYEVRERATRHLMTDDRITAPMLARALHEATDTERRLRLTRVLLHRFVAERIAQADPPPPDTSDAAMLGVVVHKHYSVIVQPKHHAALRTPAVLITRLLPGLPANVLLHEGDLIVAIEGRAFEADIDADRFIERLQQYPPNRPVTLDVLRDGRLVRVRLRLASRYRYQQVHAMLPDELPATLSPAFARYLAALRQRHDEPTE